MTPKTLDKSIAALKKKAAAEGWAQAKYEEELHKFLEEMNGQYSDGKITLAEYDKAAKQIENAKKKMALQGKEPQDVQKQPEKSLTKAEAKDQLVKTLNKLNEKYVELMDSKQPFDKKAFYDAYDKISKAANGVENGSVSVEEALKIEKEANPILSSKPTPVQTDALTQEELLSLQNKLSLDLNMGKITGSDYLDKLDKLKAIYNNKGTMKDAEAALSSPITKEEAKALKAQIKQDYMSGKLTLDEWDEKTFAVTEALNSGKTLAQAEAETGVKFDPDAHPMSQDEFAGVKDELQQMKNAGLITEEQYKAFDDQLNNVYLNVDNLSEAKKIIKAAQAAAPKPMTHGEYIDLWEKLNAQKKSGEITAAQYKEYGEKLDALYQNKGTLDAAKAAVDMLPISDAQIKELQNQLLEQFDAGKLTYTKYMDQDAKLQALKAQGLSFSKIQQAVGLDPGTLATEKAADDLEKDLVKVYAQAKNELEAQLADLEKNISDKAAKMAEKLYDGEITQEEYDKWLQMQILTKELTKQKIDQMTGTLLDANKKAMGMINGEQLNVFADNASYQAFQITKDTGIDLMFSVYDESTAAKLLKEKPELLPRKVVNGKKDKAWNRKQISGAVLQSVIQGESIPKLAKRIAAQTASSNMKAMIRYARTAMTSAQNAGRMEMLHRAEGMGIKVKKVWLATLDGRTRDSHQKMDGRTAKVDEAFPNGLMFPGDPNGPPAEVYNCRCTLIYDYEGFPADPSLDQRLDQTTGQMVMNMSYGEWKAAKEGTKLNELNAAKMVLAEAQKKVVAAKINENKVYSGIWKDDVTLADYPDKKGSIKAKRDYYADEIQKYQDAQANGASWATDEKIEELQKKLKSLNEFDKKGQLIEDRNKALQAVQDVYQAVGLVQKAQAPSVMAPKTAQNNAKKAASASGGGNAAGTPSQGQNVPISKTGTPFTPDAYSKERKDKALWTTSRKKVDDMMRDRTGEVWSKATAAEKDAIYEYTRSYNKFNEPLRGIEYGSSKYKGVGKTDLNADYQNNGARLNAMTDIIDKCFYDHDQWFQRGCDFRGMDKFFQCDESILRYGSQKDLENALLGKTVTEYGFMSMGSAKGKGFGGGVLMNIYAPAGTKMMYVEPISAYSGASYNGAHWDGKQKQSNFGSEFETIMQQGTQFRVTKVERSGSKVYVDIEVINQDNQQRYKK